MRERVLLFGDKNSRPEGMERALVRAGFALSEGASAGSSDAPDLVLVTAGDAGAELERALGFCRSRAWTGVPVIALLGSSLSGGITRALSLGAADAIAAPVDLTELCARLEARLRSRAELLRAAGAGSLQAELLLAIGEVASAQRPDEMLEKLVNRIGVGLAANHCACLIPSTDGRYARVVAAHDNPTMRDLNIDLFHYPEAVEAIVSGRSVHAPEVLRDGLFLAHLAQWPDSPEVREIESAAAVPLITHRSVRAVIVIRTRRGDPPLSAEQVALIEQLVNSTAALLEREDRRLEDWRGQGVGSVTDPLTGCATPEALNRRLRQELDRAARYGTGLALVLLGIDSLRELVTRLGPKAGDPFLSELGALFNNEVRSPDLVARYGTDEFAILLPATGAMGARRVVQRLSLRLDTSSWSHFPLTRRPRLAAGVAVFPHAGIVRMEDLLIAAEAGLREENGGAGPVGRTAA
jgi:diguanylate cyclase (GGDEF)-like protein